MAFCNLDHLPDCDNISLLLHYGLSDLEIVYSIGEFGDDPKNMLFYEIF